MDVGKEIRRAREARGWSQAKLAGASDMGVSGISQIETGARNPSVTTLSKIAAALGLGVSDLFPKAQAPLPDIEDERRPTINYQSCRVALDGFCDYWQETLDADRVDLRALEDFNAAAACWSPTYLELWGAEKAELGPQEGADSPAFHSERSTLWPAISRFIALGMRMDRIAHERFGRHGGADVIDLFTKEAS